MKTGNLLSTSLRWMCCLGLIGIVGSVASADDKKSEKDDKEPKKEFVATHIQVGKIDICSADKTLGLNAFCLDSSGNILAAVGKSTNAYGRKEKDEKLEAGIRVFNSSGEMTNYWPLEFSPQAIGYGDDDFIYVGGEGKIAKLNREGKVQKVMDAPNLGNREEMVASLKKQQIENQKRLVKTYTTMIERLEKQVASLEEIEADDEKEMTKVQKNRLKQNRQMVKTYKNLVETQSKAEVSDAMIQSMIERKSKISSISATDGSVYVACAATEGYGFEVWRTTKEFEKPEKLIKGLSGCCGQMDVQVRQDGIFVAENSRHRVVHYDLKGKQVKTFGKRDAKGENGFGSCCNPMNVCFCKGKDILTAESGTGRIMKFNAEGEKIGVIGSAKITGGCKNVAVHATNDLDTVYMLDLTGKSICVLKPKADDED